MLRILTVADMMAVWLLRPSRVTEQRNRTATDVVLVGLHGGAAVIAVTHISPDGDAAVVRLDR
jgi:hypothetical protein